jgi:hypothetical protein
MKDIIEHESEQSEGYDVAVQFWITDQPIISWIFFGNFKVVIAIYQELLGIAGPYGLWFEVICLPDGGQPM